MTEAAPNVMTEEIKDERLASSPVRPLGHRNGVYFFLSPIGELRSLKPSDFTMNGLASLFEGDTQWLEKNFTRTDRKGREVDGYELNDAVCCLMLACRNEGLYDQNMPVRGVGVWRGPGNDETRAPLIVHCGDMLFIGSKWQEAGVRIGNALYPAAPRIQRIADAASTADDGRFLLEALKKWVYKRPALDPLLILGFIGQAMLGGAPRWRAHMYVTGPKGTGKSLLADTASAALGAAAHEIKNNFTEASLRQSLNEQARCMLLDESENEENGGRVLAVIELLRHMSSGAGAKVSRGSSGGTSQSFSVTGCAYLSSILHVPLKPQDKSRITCISLDRLPPASGAQLEEIEGNLRRLVKLSPAFRRRLVDNWQRFIEAFDIYRAAFMARGLPSRAADQLSSLFAGKEILLNDFLPDSDSVDDDVAAAAPLIAELMQEEEDGEGLQCLNHLYSAFTENMRNGNKMTLGQAIMESLDTTDNKVIGAYGLRIEVSQEAGKILIIATRSVGLNRLFHGTRWAQGVWIQALQDVGTENTGKTHRFGGAPSRGYIIPQKFWPKDMESAA